MATIDFLSRRLGLQILFDYTDIVDAIQFARKEGFGVLEVNLGNIRFGEQLRRIKERKRIKRAAEKAKIRLALHALEGPSFFIPSERVRRCIVAELKKTIDLAADIGAENVIIHLGFDMHYGMGGTNRFTHEEFPDYFTSGLFKMLAELKGYAQDRTRLCVENVGGFRFEPSRRVLNRLLGGNLGLCFDIGHISILPEEKKRKEWAFFQRHKRKVYHSHLHDNNGVKDEHKPLGEGSNDLFPYLRFLVKTKALLVFETRPKEAALRARDFFNQNVLPRL
ncbi:MAG: sugar phosphate isomerase/epimerase family protein [candidate division WOR-3 bacterium]